MADGIEIERKFLVSYPDIEALDPVRIIDIVQTYLENGEGGSQRRVRRITENGSDTFVYTEKVFITAVTRIENEREITADEYDVLIKEKREDGIPVEKRRVCFDHLGQMFELDLYPFSKSLAILELELSDASQEIIFPDTVNIIKEVTGIEEYSNASLANAGAFPDDAGGDQR